MQNKSNYYNEPVLFISRSGASKVGIRIISKIPNYIRGFDVSGPIFINGDTGYYLYLIPANSNEIPAPITQYTLQILQESV